MEPEIYKITTINDDGVEIVDYVLPQFKRMFKKMMAEEYGNAEEEGMMLADAPQAVQEAVKLRLNT